MKLSDYDNYFEDIATRLTDIAHTEEVSRFAHYHIEEVITGLRGNLDLKGYCLLLEDPTGIFYKVASEQIKDLQTGAILILRHVPLDDFDQERVVLAKSLELCREVAARMLEDQILAINTTDKPRFLRGLQIGGFQYQKAAQIFDNCYGYRLEFQYLDTEALIIHPDSWIS
jgi:hypothetical protein